MDGITVKLYCLLSGFLRFPGKIFSGKYVDSCFKKKKTHFYLYLSPLGTGWCKCIFKFKFKTISLTLFWAFFREYFVAILFLNNEKCVVLALMSWPAASLTVWLFGTHLKVLLVLVLEHAKFLLHLEYHKSSYGFCVAAWSCHLTNQDFVNMPVVSPGDSPVEPFFLEHGGKNDGGRKTSRLISSSG